MRTTASYDLFPDARSERALARARWLAREGRVHDAQSAYDDLLAAKPELKAAWAEYFELLRANGRGEDALQLADRARAIFGDTGFAFTLRGAALTELRRYQAAEVAFEGAAQAAAHAEQRADAEREIATTRRYGSYTPRRPEDLTAAERWFADTGSVVLASTPGPVAPSDETIVATFAEVATNADWRFGQVILLGPEFPASTDLADRLGAPLVSPAALDLAACPLIVGLRPPPGTSDGWNDVVAKLTSQQIGLVFAIEHPSEVGAGAA